MAVKPRVASDDGRYAGLGAVTSGPDWTYVILKERRVSREIRGWISQLRIQYV